MARTDDWGDGWNEGREQAIRDCIAAVEAAIGDRIRDLKSCGKADDCGVWADACDVALDDALIALHALLDCEGIERDIARDQRNENRNDGEQP